VKYDQPKHLNAIAYKNNHNKACQHIFADKLAMIEPENKIEEQKCSGQQNGDCRGIKKKTFFPVSFK
jgi:hypothetical protein